MSKIIGKGTYGCVYKPLPKCKNIEDCPPSKEKCVKGVSKLTFKDAANEEVKHVLIIDKIDPNQIYHIGDPVVCDPEKSFDTNDCSSVKGEKDLKFLVYDDGGTPFNEFIYSDNLDVVKFIKGFENIFFAIKEMSEHGFVHADIKGPNIMVDEKYNFKLIDFGMSWTNVPIINVDYVFWPPEYVLLGSQKYFDDEDIKIEQLEDYRSSIPRYEFVKMLGKDVSDKFWEKFKHTSGEETFRIIKSKVDLYSLGIYIKKYIRFIFIKNIKLGSFLKSIPMDELIEQMIDENFYERLTPQQAYNIYLEISKEYIEQLKL